MTLWVAALSPVWSAPNLALPDSHRSTFWTQFFQCSHVADAEKAFSQPSPNAQSAAGQLEGRMFTFWLAGRPQEAFDAGRELFARQWDADPQSAALTLHWLEAIVLDLLRPQDLTEALLPYANRLSGKPSFLQQRLLWHLGHQLLGRGQREKAIQLFDQMNAVENCWLLGPFENEGGQGFRTPGPVETHPLDEHARFPTISGEQGWWRPSRHPLDGMWPLRDLLPHEKEAYAYAVAFVQVKSPSRLYLQIGSPGPVAVWFGGTELLRLDFKSGEYFHQANTPAVSVQPGVYPLLLKVGENPEKGAWSIWASLQSADGTDRVENPFAFARDFPTSSALSHSPQVQSVGTVPESATDPRNILRPPGVDNTGLYPRFRLALLSHFESLHDQKTKWPATVLDEAREAAPDGILLPTVFGSVTDELNKKRAAFREALARDPNLAPARIGLVSSYVDTSLFLKAEEFVPHPDTDASVPPSVALTGLRWLWRVGRGHEAEVAAASLAKAYPENGSVRLRCLEDFSNHLSPETRQSLYEELAKSDLCLDRAALHRELFAAALRAEKLNEAEEHLREILSYEPFAAGEALQLAQALNASRQSERALKLLEESLAVVPQNPALVKE
ncbi:MAG: tetratricopeptide repeat protein, partial [bacterium]